MTIWLIGILFTWGLTIGEDDDDGLGYSIKLALCVTFLWPIILGVFVATKLKDK